MVASAKCTVTPASESSFDVLAALPGTKFLYTQLTPGAQTPTC